MKLNDKDARAVDLVLDGPSGLASEAGPQKGQPAGSFFKFSSGVGPASPADGASGAVNGMGATSNDNLAQRVEQVDSMLKLLDYLPADEPPADLVHRTLRRVEEVRSAAGKAKHDLGGAYPNAGIGNAHLPHSPQAGREEDPTAG